MSKNIAIVALTNNGKNLAITLKEKLKEEYCTIYTTEKIADNRVEILKGKTTVAISQLFKVVDVLICIMATGIVIRSIASVVADKDGDPAVIVMDEKANNVISLLSGHLGGANELTVHIANLLNSNPVITTATDTQGLSSLDMIAKQVNGWHKNLRKFVIPFNAAIANGKTVYFYQEKQWINPSTLKGLTVITFEQLSQISEDDLLIALTTTPYLKENVANIIPKMYILGVGARKNVDPNIFYENFKIFIKENNISENEIALIASIDVKKEEKAIVELSKRLEVPFITYTKEELLVVAHKYPQSEFVRKTVGVGSVALASADLASKNNVLTERFAKDGCTYALGKYLN